MANKILTRQEVENTLGTGVTLQDESKRLSTKAYGVNRGGS